MRFNIDVDGGIFKKCITQGFATGTINTGIETARDISFLSRVHSGHAVAYWLRHYATNRKVAGSIPDEVNF
jgi:hypothetical protein